MQKPLFFPVGFRNRGIAIAIIPVAFFCPTGRDFALSDPNLVAEKSAAKSSKSLVC
jgi:hypothetical protein